MFNLCLASRNWHRIDPNRAAMASCMTCIKFVVVRRATGFSSSQAGQFDPHQIG
jgi:hypothetical protein